MTQTPLDPTPYDSPLAEAVSAAIRAAAPQEGMTALQSEQYKQQAASRVQQLRTMREQFVAAQAALTDRIGTNDYDRWRKHGWFMPPHHDPVAQQVAERGEPVLLIQHKEMGGHITVQSREVNYHGTAAKDAKAIEAGVLHAKENWQKSMTIDGGDAEFRATAWAYAQIHGVKVIGYKPKVLSKEWKLARTIISRENAARKAADRLKRDGKEIGDDGLPVLKEPAQPARAGADPAGAPKPGAQARNDTREPSLV